MQVHTTSVNSKTPSYAQALLVNGKQNNLKSSKESLYSSPAFQSLGTGPLGRFSINFFEAINSKLVYNFLILDAFGMVLPRVWQAYKRNSEEIGHGNSAAAVEEFIREGLSGPSIVLLPIFLTTLMNKYAGKSVETSKHLLDEFHTITKGMVNDTELQAKLADNLNKIRELSKLPAQAEEYRSKVQTQVTDEFYKRIIDQSLPKDSQGRQNLTNKLLKELKYYGPDEITNVKVIVSTHNKLHNTFPERPFHIHYPSNTLKGKEVASGNIATLVQSAKNYVDDVVAKVAPFADHSKFCQMVDNIHQKILAAKIIAGIGGVIAVAAALRLIPVFYSSLHKTFPGVYGLTDDGNKPPQAKGGTP